MIDGVSSNSEHTSDVAEFNSDRSDLVLDIPMSNMHKVVKPTRTNYTGVVNDCYWPPNEVWSL